MEDTEHWFTFIEWKDNNVQRHAQGYTKIVYHLTYSLQFESLVDLYEYYKKYIK